MQARGVDHMKNEPTVLLVTPWMIVAALALLEPPAGTLPQDAASRGTADIGDVLEIGVQPPDFMLSSIDGDSFALGDLRGVQSAVLVFFRGAW